MILHRAFRQSGRTTRMYETAAALARNGRRVVVLMHNMAMYHAARGYMEEHAPGLPWQVGLLADWIRSGDLNERLQWRRSGRDDSESLLIDHAAIESMFPQVITQWARWLSVPDRPDSVKVAAPPPLPPIPLIAGRRMRLRRGP